MKVTLTILERLGLVRLLNDHFTNGKMDLLTMVRVQDAIKKIAFEGTLTRTFNADRRKDEIKKVLAIEEPDINKKVNDIISTIENFPSTEWVQTGDYKKYDMKLIPVSQTESQWEWDKEIDTGAEIELEDSGVEVLKTIIKDKSDKKELGLKDSYLLTLTPKLGIETK